MIRWFAQVSPSCFQKCVRIRFIINNCISDISAADFHVHHCLFFWYVTWIYGSLFFRLPCFCLLFLTFTFCFIWMLRCLGSSLQGFKVSIDIRGFDWRLMAWLFNERCLVWVPQFCMGQGFLFTAPKAPWSPHPRVSSLTNPSPAISMVKICQNQQ